MYDHVRAAWLFPSLSHSHQMPSDFIPSSFNDVFVVDTNVFGDSHFASYRIVRTRVFVAISQYRFMFNLLMLASNERHEK